MAFEQLVKPIHIGSMELKNRMIMPGMGTNLAALDGTVSDIIVDYYQRRADGGVGLIITEVCCPEARGRVIAGEMELTNLGFVPGLSRVAAAAHSGGAKIALQLAHGGCFASESVSGLQPYCPSGVATALLPEDKPREMTIEEIKELVKAYGLAAQRARMAGFDAVELHGAHGYMPLQFLSGYTNRRTDEYGGSLRNRARFALEVIRSIKEHAGKDFPLIYRLSAEEHAPGGITLEEAMEFAKWAEQEGADAIHVTAGTWDSRMEEFMNVLTGKESTEGKKLSHGVSIGVWVPPIYVPRGNLIRLAEGIKKSVTVPVIAVCGISPEMAEDVIALGKADLVSLGRQSIADPDYANKVAQNKPEEIRRCVRCNECLGSVLSYKALDCAVNPEAGKEHECFTKMRDAKKSKKVMVVGGGPAGMEAAIVAASRGHEVTVYEKSESLGGMLRYLSIPEFKKDYYDFMQWQITEMERQKVKVVTGVSMTAEKVKEENPDTVIVATGAKPFSPKIKGIEQEGIFGALEILDGKVPEGEKVLVCGAGLVGAEVAMHLAEVFNKKVVLIDKLPSAVPEVETFSQWVVQGKLAELGIDMRVSHAIEEIGCNKVVCNHNGEEVVIEGDAVVAALGMKADRELLNDLSEMGITAIPVGDAVKARKVIQAIHEGYHAGRRI